MLKILYISPENTVGVLSIWKRAHEEMGNYCRFVTFYHHKADYEEDICLNLPLISTSEFFIKFREIFSKVLEKRDYWDELEGYPPYWNPPHWKRVLFGLRDKIWEPKVKRAIKEYSLEDFDVYHFEWGIDFFRDCRFAKRLERMGKKIICHYHGKDIRNRGVIRELDDISDLNLTNELDLLYKHPKMKYLFLPFDVRSFKVKDKIGDPITIVHAPTNRKIKGTEFILEAISKLKKKYRFNFIILENMPYPEVLKIKKKADLVIDQVTDLAWGYGMNSIEALSMGIACATYLNPTYEEFIPDHPFINIYKDELESKLEEILKNPEILAEKGRQGRAWVEKYHDYRNVVRKLYEYYKTDLNIRGI
ncbi:MAG: glycosyltransferase [Candidatus Marinimicrobia bacterium]|nr:glycosyltransferase [Candidatus Neomarinimicrobiota bacterium]